MAAVATDRSLPQAPIFLKAAGAAALSLVVVALFVEVSEPLVGPRDPLARATTMLVAVGALCVTGLTFRRMPSVAWLASILAAGLASAEIVGGLRAGELAGSRFSWDIQVATLARLITAAIALAYASTTGRQSAPRQVGARSAGSRIRIAAVAAFLIVVIVEAATFVSEVGDTGSPLDTWPARVANRSLLGYVALAVVLGVLLDLREPVEAARRRIAGPLTIGRTRLFIDLLADELLPYRRALRQEATERERARLAADLHAEVLPELRAALATAGAGGASPATGRRIERAVDRVEDLMSARRSAVLETFGLVAALETLAERIEERSSLRVELELGDEDEGDRPPLEVERAAFRIAQLALDNVVRHASATTATVSLEADRGRLALRIVDDGRGFDQDVRAGRGIADMRAEAVAQGASLTLDSASGTSVALRWPG